jgi:tripartite-type tricarboxylate transporter receptor subunit TctC
MSKPSAGQRTDAEDHCMGIRSTPTAALFAVLALAAAPAAAQDYPTKPVSFIVPYAAGGSLDTMGRVIGARLEQRLGKPVVVENRPGMASVIGASYVARSTPDGHTLLLATSTTMAINVSVHKNLPYDPTRDLAPIAMMAANSFILVVDPALPVRSVDDLVRLARSRPGGLAYGSNGHGGIGHLLMELLAGMTGITLTHVPYKGLSPALNDLVGGHVSVVFGDFSTALPLVRDGKLRALGVSTAQRVASASDIHPLGEVGLPGFDGSSWWMVVAAAGTPKPIVDRLNGELRAIMADPTMQAECARRGIVALPSEPPEALPQFVRSEIERWGKVVARAGADKPQ